jgi:Fe-S-cluster containining protein
MPFSQDDQRLLELMAELTSRREYASGDLPFPRPLDPGDAAAIAADLQAAVDQGVAKRAEVAAAQGEHIACHAGCNACCEQLVMIWTAEAELIAGWLNQPENAEARRRFLEAYPAWAERSAGAIASVIARTRVGDARGQFAALVAHWRQRILCAFNHDGLCAIYAVRPVLCRNCHAVGTSEHCHPADDTGTAATSLHFKPLEEFIQRTRGLSKAMHHALGGPRGLAVPLCSAVYERLMSSTSTSEGNR